MGSGAVGGYFGGLLAKGGHDVLFVARGAHADAMRERGLVVTSVTSGEFTVEDLLITDKPDGSFKADLVLFCVKGYSNEEAIGLIRPAIYKDTTILTLQNGIGSGDILATAFGSRAVLLGAAYVEASRTGPGAIREDGGLCRIVFGEESGQTTTRAVAVDATLRGAGIETDLTGDVLSGLWTKLIFICALSGMMCLTRETMAAVLATPETLELTKTVMKETATVARARGIAVADDVEERHMAYFMEHRDVLFSSMFLDLTRGNPLEVGVLNGAVSRIGREVDVATPVNDFIVAALTPYDARARQARREGKTAKQFTPE
jgi:2-dehydropantoate 2-reductase